MAGVDSLLKMLSEHDADELQIGTHQAPRIYKRGAPVRLTIPPTNEGMLRILLGELLSPEHEAAVRTDGKLDLSHVSGKGEHFSVALKRRGTGIGPLTIDVIFRRKAAASSPPPARIETPPVAVAPPPRVQSAAEASLPSALLSLLQRAVALRASDLHLFSGEPAAFRVDGSLRRDDERAISVEAVTEGWLDETAREALKSGRSADLAIDVAGLARFRFNFYRAAGRLAGAIRILPHFAPALADLHMPLAIDDLVSVPHGLVIVCGPTGSGKSATLSALAQSALAGSARQGRARMLISLEDPVEYTIQANDGGLVRQRQVGTDVRDFPTGLRDALREDPDILLIGEMRDSETISLAMTAAETGHLVLTSLHSRSAAASVERIVDSYPAGRQHQIRIQLADSLRAIVSQRLIPTARGNGRIPAVEIMRGSASVGSLIREGKTAQLATAIQSGRKEGMLTLERCLADLVRGGQVDMEQAMIAANDTEALTSYLK